MKNEENLSEGAIWRQKQAPCLKLWSRIYQNILCKYWFTAFFLKLSVIFHNQQFLKAKM